MTLFALQNGLLDKYEPVDVRDVLKMFLQQVHTRRPDLVASLVEQQEMTDEIKEGLNEQLAQFNGSAI